VSLARVLVVEPSVLLLDEPFSALDAALRIEMRELVLGLQRELGVTALFVTHDQEEAVVLADRIALVLAGRLQQYAPPTDFYDAPASLPAARFFGVANLLPGMVSAGVHTSALGAVAVEAPDGHGTLVVRQEAVALTGPHMPGALPGRVHAATFLGTSMRVTVALPVAGRLRIDHGLEHPAEEPAHELAAVGGAERLDHSSGAEPSRAIALSPSVSCLGGFHSQPHAVALQRP